MTYDFEPFWDSETILAMCALVCLSAFLLWVL